MAAPRHPVRVGLRFPVRVNMADTIAFGAIPEWMMLGWNLFQPDPIVGPEPVFYVASPNYDESGNNIGLNQRVDAVKGLWMGPGYTQYAQNSKFEGAGIGVSPSGWSVATVTNDGITRSIVGFGPGYIDVRVSGTCVGVTSYQIVSMSSLAYPVAALSETWTGQDIVTLLSGDWSAVSPRVEMQEVTSAGVYLASSATSLVGKSGKSTSNTRTLTNASVGKIRLYPFMCHVPVGTTVDFVVRIEQTQLTKTATVMPYIATGIGETKTQLTNAATTGGNGVNIPLDAGLTAAYSGQNSFLDRIYFGFSSAQISADTALRSVRNATTDVLYVSTGGVIKSSDGTNTATVTVTGGWSAEQIISLYRRTTGTQMQVGYRKAGETAITWGALVAYDGSDNPGTHERCCLNGTLPIWGQAKATANKYCTDSELLEMEALAA